MSAAIVHKTSERRVSRPLKILIPLISEELTAGAAAGLDHYRKAGELLIEAKDLITHGSWGQWLSKNFELHQTQARKYMRLARKLAGEEEDDAKTSARSPFASMRGILGERNKPVREEWKSVKEAADKVNVTRLADERQAKEKEIKLHQELALRLIDLGYRAMATRLHPDRGGSREAMSRLNTVRDELKEIAATKRFV